MMVLPDTRTIKEVIIMAKTIREYRENRGLTQEELAEKAHIPVELIRAIEDGKEVILPTLQAESISKALRSFLRPKNNKGFKKAFHFLSRKIRGLIK